MAEIRRIQYTYSPYNDHITITVVLDDGKPVTVGIHNWSRNKRIVANALYLGDTYGAGDDRLIKEDGSLIERGDSWIDKKINEGG